MKNKPSRTTKNHVKKVPHKEKYFDDTISHRIRELEQEKIILESLNDYLSNDKKIDELFTLLKDKLRNPMVPIKSYVEMLIAGQFGELNELQRKKLKLISDSILQLEDNIRSTLK